MESASTGNDDGTSWSTEDTEGDIIKERSIPNDNGFFETLVALIAWASSNEVFIAIETRRLVLVEALLARGFKVFTINPKQSERFRDRFSVAADARRAQGARSEHTQCI